METITDPAPSMAKKIWNVKKSGAKKLPKDENATSTAPANSNHLCLDRIAKILIRNARTTSAVLLTVLVWPATPIAARLVEPRNVLAISGKNKADTAPAVPVAKTAKAKDGTNSLFGDSFSSTGVSSLMPRASVIKLYLEFAIVTYAHKKFIT